MRTEEVVKNRIVIAEKNLRRRLTTDGDGVHQKCSNDMQS